MLNKIILMGRHTRDSFAVPDGFTPDFGGESGEMPF